MHTSNPINIVSQKGSTVTFSVEQTWIDEGTLSWIGVFHTQTVGELECAVTESIDDTTENYVSLCVDGVAEVALFVRDTSFEGQEDISGLMFGFPCVVLTVNLGRPNTLGSLFAYTSLVAYRP